MVTQGSGFRVQAFAGLTRSACNFHLAHFLRTFITRSNKAVGGVSSLSESLSFESLLQPVHQHVHVLLSLLSFSVLLLWIEMQVTKSLPTPGECSSRRAAFPRMYLLFFSCSPLWFRVSETVAEESRREDLVCPPQSRGHLSSLFIYLFFLRRTNSWRL